MYLVTMRWWALEQRGLCDELVSLSERGDGHVKTEAEIRAFLPLNQGGLRLPALGEARTHPPPEALEGAWPCHHLDFELVASRTVK